MQTFFAVNAEVVKSVHTQIASMLYFGKGWDLVTLYNLPNKMREFHFRWLEEIIEKEREKQEEANKS